MLIGTGAALFVGGLGYDISLIDERDELDEIQAICPDCTTAQFNRGEELGQPLVDSKPVIWSLYGVGAAVAVSGLVWLLLNEGGAETTMGVSAGPALRPDGVGLLVQFEH